MGQGRERLEICGIAPSFRVGLAVLSGLRSGSTTCGPGFTTLRFRFPAGPTIEIQVEWASTGNDQREPNEEGNERITELNGDESPQAAIISGLRKPL